MRAGLAQRLAREVGGTFKVQDDRITLWRDYFDWVTFLAASAKGLGGVLLSALNARPKTT